jgi:hypothetical protein
LPPPTERPRSGAARPPERRRTASSSPLRLSDVLERHHAGPVHSGSANSAAPTGSRAPFRYYLGSEVREDARSGTDGSSTTPARRTRSRNPDGPTLHEIPRGTRRTRRRVPRPMPRSERGRRSREGPPSLCREFGEGAGCVGPTRWPTTTRQLVPPQRSVVPETKFCQGAGGEPFRVPLARHRKLDDPRRDKFG